MTSLHTLKDTARGSKKRKRVGRGPGSGMGKTSCRGQKGEGARSGTKRRYGKEGGQFPLYMKLPTRGFSNAAFKKQYACINLGQLQQLIDANAFAEADVINLKTLAKAGYFKGANDGLKILGDGELTKPVTIEAVAATASAREKLQKVGATLQLMTRKEQAK